MCCLKSDLHEFPRSIVGCLHFQRGFHSKSYDGPETDAALMRVCLEWFGQPQFTLPFSHHNHF